jgi:hypothetical protein
MLFKKIIAVHTENNKIPIKTKCTVTGSKSRWYIYLPIVYKRLMAGGNGINTLRIM